MINPRYVKQVADRHPGWNVIDDQDIDEDGTVDLAIRDANGELVWFNGYRRKPAERHTYQAKDWFVQNPSQKPPKQERLPTKSFN